LVIRCQKREDLRYKFFWQECIDGRVKTLLPAKQIDKVVDVSWINERTMHLKVLHGDQLIGCRWAGV